MFTKSSLIPNISEGVKRRITLTATAFDNMKKKIWSRKYIKINSTLTLKIEINSVLCG